MHSRTLLAGTALMAVAHPLAAQSVISTPRTTPVVTSTVNGGQPADVRIESAGSITVTGGAAITVDSDNNVTNAGSIAISNADNATGILVTGLRIANITNSGTITIDETYTGTDTDNAAMIAWAGMERFRLGHTDGPGLAARSRWPLDEGAAPVIGSGKRGAKA